MVIGLKKLFFLLVCFLFILPYIHAGSLGMSPSSFGFNFEPNMEETIVIRVASSDMAQPISIYIAGDLSQYVNISSKNFTGVGVLEVKIKLPEKLDRPGNHRILIGAREEKEISAGGTIGGVSAIQVPIDIFVPYPGKYAEAEFNINNANENEDVFYKLVINNLGTQAINFDYNLNVLSDSLNSSSVFYINGNNSLEPNMKMTIEDKISGLYFKPGNYIGFAKINYGSKIDLNSSFVIGTFLLNISDYDYEFISGEINLFNLYATSFWNSKINEAYSEVSVSDLGVVKSYFKSSSYSFEPLEEKKISGYIDATNITPGRYIGNIILSYDGKTTNKLVAFYFNKPEMTRTEKLLYVAFGIIALLVLITIILLIKLFLKRRALRKNGKK